MVSNNNTSRRVLLAGLGGCIAATVPAVGQGNSGNPSSERGNSGKRISNQNGTTIQVWYRGGPNQPGPEGEHVRVAGNPNRIHVIEVQLYDVKGPSTQIYEDPDLPHKENYGFLVVEAVEIRDSDGTVVNSLE